MQCRSADGSSASSAKARENFVEIKSRVGNGHNVAVAPLADEPSALRRQDFLVFCGII
ncbi:MAG: hypothetical protein ACR2MG_03860 [Pyrinomonadaceae bacterium]